MVDWPLVRILSPFCGSSVVTVLSNFALFIDKLHCISGILVLFASAMKIIELVLHFNLPEYLM